MPDLGPFFIFGLASYLLGAVPFGYMAGRLNGMDIRTMGSGNIGATNVARCLGRGWGVLTFCCDMLKGFLPVFLFPQVAARLFSNTNGEALSILCAACAVAGHNWPTYLRFKGGKGISTSLGALLGIAPQCAGIGVAVWIITFVSTRYVSVASIAGVISVAVAAWFFHAGTGLLIPAALSILAGAALWRHKPNIRRLLQGTEQRFKFGSSSGDSA